MYLFFDTETTGVPLNYSAPVKVLHNWPRIVQLAWTITDENKNVIQEENFIIKPLNFIIPPEATKIHNITTEMANKKGVILIDVMKKFNKDVKKADVVIAHNLNFDEKVIEAEAIRIDLDQIFRGKNKLCTMLAGIKHCALPYKNGDFKWPKLEELYLKLFDQKFENGHDALTDVKATMNCFWKLREKNYI